MKAGGPIAVVGAGSWGTTLAQLIADKGAEVDLWVYEPELCQTIRETRQNDVYLPGVTLSGNITAHNDLERVVKNRRGKTPSVGMNIVILKENFHTLHDLIELCATAGAQLRRRIDTGDLGCGHDVQQTVGVEIARTGDGVLPGGDAARRPRAPVGRPRHPAEPAPPATVEMRVNSGVRSPTSVRTLALVYFLRDVVSSNMLLSRLTVALMMRMPPPPELASNPLRSVRPLRFTVMAPEMFKTRWA